MTPDEIERYRAHIGRTQTEHDVVSPELVKRFAAAVDRPFPGAGKPLPPMWHYAFFATDTPTASLGPDGHPPRGEFMPPVKLPRRMFAGSSLRFHQAARDRRSRRRKSPRSSRSITAKARAAASSSCG